MLERALVKERAKIPELRKQAENYVGQAAPRLHKKSVEELFELRDQTSAKLTECNAIRAKCRHEINKQAPGYVAWQWEERHCWGPPKHEVMLAAASEQVINQAVQQGQALYKNAVHDPAVTQFKSLAERFEDVLRKFVG
jgi:hypothetical protein